MQQNPHYTMFFKKISLPGLLFISQERKDIVNFQLYLHLKMHIFHHCFDLYPNSVKDTS